MQKVLHITGCLEFSDPQRTVSNVFGHALESAVQHKLDHEVLDGDAVNSRFPGYHLPSHFKASLSRPGCNDATEDYSMVLASR